MYGVLAALGCSSFERAMSTVENSRFTHSVISSFERAMSTVDKLNDEHITLMRKTKGQLRNAKPKSSGAAQLKRNAKKRNNINSRKGK
jgi:hypothetical protein